MKKTAIKELMNQTNPFGPVTVTSGPLSGMTFTVEDHTQPNKGRVKVKYVAPDGGPRVVVDHMEVRNEFRMEDRCEDVRIAFAKLLPANILWSKESGYSERKSGTALAWDRQLARFVVRKQEPVETQVSKDETNKGEE